MKKEILFIFLLFYSSILNAGEVLYAGVRSSSNGINPFPQPAGWHIAIQTMAEKWDGSTPFQIGRSADRDWWNGYEDPPKRLGDELAGAIDQECGIIWVDFTLREVLSTEPVLSHQAAVGANPSPSRLHIAAFIDPPSLSHRSPL